MGVGLEAPLWQQGRGFASLAVGASGAYPRRTPLWSPPGRQAGSCLACSRPALSYRAYGGRAIVASNLPHLGCLGLHSLGPCGRTGRLPVARPGDGRAAQLPASARRNFAGPRLASSARRGPLGKGEGGKLGGRSEQGRLCGNLAWHARSRLRPASRLLVAVAIPWATQL